jgi:carbamoyltransferase
MRILSLNFSHDGCGVILDEGRLAAYVSTERFSRFKKQPGIREADLDELLDQAGLPIEKIDLVMLNNVGMDSSELQERHGRDFKDTWLRFQVNDDTDRVSLRGREFRCLKNLDHFLCHSAVAYYYSPFDQALCFSYDAIASGAHRGEGSELHQIRGWPVTKVGDLYTRISIELGLGGLFGAGKTMGLAPYGRHEDPALHEVLRRAGVAGTLSSERMDEQIELIRSLSRDPVHFLDGDKRWDATMAFHIQKLLDYEVVEHLSALAKQTGGRPNLCLSGGTALNSVTNQLLFETGLFSDIYLHPACGDDGTALGAALYWWHFVGRHPKILRENREAMYSRKTYPISEATFAPDGARIIAEPRSDYIAETARLLSEGKVVGWFQGASEIGPRALGNRSILGDPRDPQLRDRLNKRIKRREAFRPFAPSVLNERALDWFDVKDSPFMLRVAKVTRPDLPSITHADGTARLQTVEQRDNPNYHALISAFEKITGVPIVLNTSFNIGGEPIVETPAEAIASFLGSEIDRLVFPGWIVSKRNKE